MLKWLFPTLPITAALMNMETRQLNTAPRWWWSRGNSCALLLQVRRAEALGTLHASRGVALDESMDIVLSLGVFREAKYRNIPRIRPPFDAQKSMPKIGGGLLRKDLTFYIKVKSRNSKLFKISKESGMS